MKCMQWRLENISPPLSYSSKVTLAGNAMHVPTVAVLLAIVLMYSRRVQ